MSGLEGLLLGRVLGERYRIEEVIGRGGMGAVYRATDERLGRQVAVKVITIAGMLDAESRERLRARFLREARAAAALPHHPSVVPVYDYGSDAALGLDYLVMELLRGEDLASRLARSGRPPLPVALTILREAARGLAVGHRAGLVHRDVKPGNIFLAQGDDGELHVRIVDFGIAKAIAEEDTLTSLTQDGRAPLSPAYASPEQLRGLTRLSPASDVFGLGAVGFQLLTGERAYSDSDRNRLSLGLAVEPPSLRQRNPALPDAVEEVIQKALAYDPVDRYPDAAAFGSVLDQAMRELGDAPLPRHPPTSTTVWAAAPAPPAAPRADDDDRTMLAPEGAPPPSADDDRTLLAPEPPRVGATELRPSAPRVTPPRRERGIGALVVWTLVALVLVVAGAAVWWFGRGDQVSLRDRLAHLDTTAVVVDTVAPPPDTAPGVVEQPSPSELNQEGNQLFNQGDYATALERFRLALAADPFNADYRYNYAVALLRTGDTNAAARELEEVIRRDPGRPDAFYYLAEARITQGDTASAMVALEQVLQLNTTQAQRDAVARRLAELRGAGVEPLLPPDTAVAPDTAAPPPADGAR